MGAAKFLALIFLIILTIPMILGFVISYSIDRNIKDDLVEDLITGTLEEIIEEQIDTDAALQLVKEQCSSEDSISVEGYEISIDCSLINQMNDEEIKMILENSKKQIINSSLKIESPALENAEAKISKYLNYIKLIMLAFGILALVMIFIIFLVGGSISKFLISLGIVGFISGLFTFLIRGLKNSITFENSEAVESLIINTLSTAQSFLFIMMLISLFVFGAGIYFSKFGQKEK